MSAIGLLPRPTPKLIVSRHADWRREDFVFPRTQSAVMRDMPWEDRAQPLKSWDRMVYSCVGLASLGFAVLELLR